MALNEKQIKFAKEYCVDLNATQAAIRAGYSAKTAYSQGQRLLKHVEVSARIEKSQEKYRERYEITREKLIDELAKIAFGDIRDMVKWTGSRITLIPSKEITDDIAAAISEVTKGKFGISIKRQDKIRALELIAKLAGIYDDKPKPEAPRIMVDEP